MRSLGRDFFDNEPFHKMIADNEKDGNQVIFPLSVIHLDRWQAVPVPPQNQIAT